MKNFYISVLLLFSFFIVDAQCVTNVDFNTWQASGNPAYGNWVVQGGGTQVRQTVNATGPGFFISPFPLMNVRITGNFRTTDNDDDWMGFAFSFQNPMNTTTDTFDCWFFDWKQVTQGAGQRGMSLCKANGVIPPSDYQATFWDHINSPAFTVVQNNWGSAGWQTGYNHAFELQLTYTSASIYIDGVLKFQRTDCFKPGRFGFYCISQQDVYYSNFQYDVFTDFSFLSSKICAGDSAKMEFVNPCINDPTALGQYQTATWNFGDGSAPVVINNPTIYNINQTHYYAQSGNYNVSLSITDFNGCSYTATNVLEVRPPIVVTPSGTPPSCNGGTNGSATVQVTGGYGNYQYSWNGGANTGQNYNGIGAGTYNVVVNDGICAAVTANYTLTQPSAISATTSHQDANCGTNNGSVTMTITGGTTPYQNLSWGGVAAPSGTRSGLGAGTYIANFQDANGCSALLQYSETVNSLPCGINSSLTKTNVSCFGGSNGTAFLNVTGSTGTQVITWTPGNYTGANVSGLPAGTYTYNFSDANPSHAFSGTVTITQPGAAMVASLSTIGISCAGANDGQALASVTSGGNAPYTYTWTGGHPNNPSATNLPPGPISVTITDANGCTATASGNISSSPTLTSTMVTVIDSCYHSGRGRATIQVSGGVPPYSYNWSNFATDTTNLQLFAGTYTVTVTDGNGCTFSTSALVGGPANSLVAPNTKQDIACAGTASGSMTVTASGGTGPYSYAWNPNSLSGSNPTGLTAGIYQYTVTDNYGCSITGDDTLLEPAAPLSVTSTHTNVTCSGAANGSITVTVGGGTAPYTYMGNTVPAGTYTQGNLPAGIYSGTVTDANGCTASISDTITEPAAQSLSLTKTDVTCNGGNNGSATASFVNATGAVTYNWNPGGVQSGNYTGLTAGTYAVTATDANTCTVSGSIAVNQPPAIQVQEAHNNVSCFGFTDGDVTLTVTSNTGPYTYTWSPNVSSSNTASNLGSGVYNITVTDASICSVSTSVVVTQPFAAVKDSLVVQDVTCFGLTDGRITIYTTGGTGSYTYTWSPNVSSTSNASNLQAGTYNLTVADVNNCSLTETVTITEPAAALALTQSQTDLTCFNDSTGSATVNVTGGTAPYTYNWNPNVSTANVASALAAGSYNVVVLDDHNCTITASFTLTQPTQLTATHTVTDARCYGDANGRVVVTATGGAGAPYNYSWSPAVSTNDTAQNLAAGTYGYTVMDNTGCTVSNTATVNQPADLVLSASFTNLVCNNANDGTITASAVGGASNYSYSITNDGVNFQNSTTGVYTALAPGNYVVIVADANGCVDSTSGTIANPAAITIQLVPTNVVCYGYNNGQIAATVSNATQPITYVLSNNDQNSNGTFTGLAAGPYSITATDANGCSVTDTTSITEPVEVLVSIQPDSIEINLGEVVILQSSTNQSGALTYVWSPAAGLSCSDCDAPEFNAYTSIDYALTVTNTAGCTGSATAVVNVIPSYDVYVPNAFSPNGDGANDTWTIYGNMQGIKQMSVQVFNRIGEKVFEANDINFAWDGYYKGVVSPPGVYVYVAKFVWLNNYTDTERTGSITLLK